VFGAALATLIAQGISAVFSFLIFLHRMRQYKSPFKRFDRQELYSMLRIAVPSVLQQSTVSIGMMIVQAVVNPFGTQALAGYAATMRVENVFSLIFVSIGNAVSPYISQNLGAKKIDRLKKGYHAALVLDLCFAVIAFAVIETLHTQISSLFLGKDGTALAYQVSGDYMRWLGYFFIFMGIKMATDGVLRGLGIMRPFLIANMVNLAIRLSVALLCAPRFGICLACRPGRVACKLSGLLCGAQKIVADGKCSGTSMILCSANGWWPAGKSSRGFSVWWSIPEGHCTAA
jgi:Na+-driven multidrug efflux pump